MSFFVEHVKQKGDYKVAFDTPESNWSIWMNEEGKALSIANKGKGATSSFYGDKFHILKLLNQGYFQLEGATDFGIGVLQGLKSDIRTGRMSFHRN